MQTQSLLKLPSKLLLLVGIALAVPLLLVPLLASQTVSAASVAIDYCLKPPPGFDTYTPKDNKCNSGDKDMYICPLNPTLINCTASNKAQQQAEIKAGEKTIWCISTKGKPAVKATKPYGPPLDDPTVDNSSCPSGQGYFLSSVDLCWPKDTFASELAAALPDGNCPAGTQTTTEHDNALSNVPLKTNDYAGKFPCGSGDNRVLTSIDFGCKGKGNAILDLAFSIIRFLSIGVGIIIVGSIIVAGIQYTASRGDPQATQQAIKRVTATAIALGIYIFSYAILNWIIPAGLFK